ncbi:high mobility group protein B4-like [Rattus rattus]|uniref:high mobility group protein B4-like n=1 Tax=Rattus rattus TaxID=10117 RepID=UPI0013F32D2E|nr:high mobility group protein B4-like [Rattus rattus]
MGTSSSLFLDPCVQRIQQWNSCFYKHGEKIQLRPQVNVSAYIHFMLNFRNQMEQQPNTYHDFAEFSRKGSEIWRSISKYEKAKCEVLSKLDKDRYKDEMGNYTGKRRKRRRRDANTPQKPPSYFLLFSLDNFAHLKEQNPNWTVVEVAKVARKMWSISANVDKIPYEQKAVLMRAKYLEEQDAYYQCQGRKRNFLG